jgi:hypothetical protein
VGRRLRDVLRRLAAALVSLLLIVGLPLATWLRLFAWLALGIVFYAARARQRRRAAGQRPSPLPRRSRG